MTTLAIPQPTSLVEVETRCDQIDAFWPQCETVAHVQEGQAILAAWDEYLARTSKDGRARVAASMRRGEIRIGELLGAAEVGRNQHSEPSFATEPSLNHQQRHEFRQMAQNPDLVEDVIAESTDEQPASRRKVTKRINEVSRARMDRARKAMGGELCDVCGDPDRPNQDGCRSPQTRRPPMRAQPETETPATDLNIARLQLIRSLTFLASADARQLTDAFDDFSFETNVAAHIAPALHFLTHYRELNRERIDGDF